VALEDERGDERIAGIVVVLDDDDPPAASTSSSAKRCGAS
jgi:hypothetical protein